MVDVCDGGGVVIGQHTGEETVMRAAVENPLARASRKINKDEPPQPLEFSLVHPDYLDPVQLCVSLVAVERV
jgi:hypothetical protein